MQIAKELAGFSPAQADDLRKAIGKKNAELMASLKDEFLARAASATAWSARSPSTCGTRTSAPPTTPSTRPTPPATR